MIDDAWKEEAVCRDLDVALFFPHSGENVAAEARSACARCPVTAPCLQEALSFHAHGLWAGTTITDRDRMREQRRRLERAS